MEHSVSSIRGGHDRHADASASPRARFFGLGSTRAVPLGQRAGGVREGGRNGMETEFCQHGAMPSNRKLKAVCGVSVK